MKIEWIRDFEAFRRLHGPWNELVAHSGLGTLNHSQLTLEALARRGIVPRTIVLVGEPHASNRRTLARAFGGQVIELAVIEPLEPGRLAGWEGLQTLGRTLV